MPILYEGRTAEGAVETARDLDELFEDLFAERTPEELEAIKTKYATNGHVLEAPALIADKARDMLRHYVDNILPERLQGAGGGLQPPGGGPLSARRSTGARRAGRRARDA